MMSWPTWCLILADAERMPGLERFSRGFARQAGDSNWLAVGAAVIVLCAVTLVMDRIFRSRGHARPAKSFDHLAGAAQLLGLTRRELRLLRTIAAGAELPFPTSMLLSPANLADAVRAVPEVAGKATQRAIVDGVALKLFGASLPASNAPPATSR
jgi:hypothetical protein